MTNNLTSQAATLELHGVPNDIIQNLNPITLIIFIPLMDQFVYPACQRIGFRFTPLKRIYAGFILASAAMVAAAVIQYYIYKTGKCGEYPSAECCETPAPINVWVQSVPYVLVGFSEIFTSITGYEYAFTKAPKNMKSLGMRSAFQ
jgi:POT family proton-dependent oligopeptide transporter